MIFEHPAMRVVRLPDGGFELEPDAGPGVLRVTVRGTGFRVEVPGVSTAFVMLRDDGPNGGFCVLEADGTRELGRSVGIGRFGDRREMRYVLLGDGSLFRVAPRAPREGGFEVSSSETPGAYLTARLETGGWRIEPAPACGGLEDLRILCVLFAAEILAAEEPIDPGQAV